MSKRIVYEDANGQVYVVIPAPNCPLTVEQIAAKDTPKGVKYQVVEDTDLPADRTFRNAWQLQGVKKVVVNLPKAKELHKNALRILRKPKLEALDLEFMRAVETNDVPQQKVIAAKKQMLRDVTADAAITAAETPEQLKAVLPDVLR